jgi:hypothetical protein
MGFDPREIRKGVQTAPRKVIIYGDAKIGKSTLAGASPGCLLIPTEDRVAHIDCDKTNVVTSYQEILDIFKYLETGSPYKTLVIDSLDWLEGMIHDYVCKKKGFSSLTDNKDANVNYGRGLKYYAVEAWRDFLYNLDVLRETQKMSIVLVAHSAIEKVSPPDSDSYDRYTLKLDKNAVAVLTEWTDIIAYYSRDIIVKKEDKGFGQKVGKALNIDSKRLINMESTNPAWISGNSFGLGTCEVDISDIKEVMSYILNVTETKQHKKN